MKKYALFCLMLLTGTGLAQEQKKDFSFSVGNWEMQLVSLKKFYPTYLADPLGIRNEVTAQNILFGDFDPLDRVNDEGTYWSKLIVFSGGRVSLLRFTPKSNPNLGIEADIGVSIPVVMRARNHDVIAVDGIFYFAIAGKPTEWLSLRVSKHHICTHIGDEFAYGTVNSPTDYDPNVLQLPVRDDFILSAAAEPLYFLGIPHLNILRIYGEFGWFWPGGDFMGLRQNVPNRHAYLNLQGGAEMEYYFKKPYFGGVFTALNVSAYQSNSFSPNCSFVAGYIFPQERDRRRLRVGIQYYNGRSLSNQFFNRKEKLVAFSVALDL